MSAIPTGIADTVLARLQPAVHAVVGNVRSVGVEAFGTPPQGAKASLLVLDPVVQNEILETVSDGSLAVTFIDGMDLTLGEDATAIIDEFIFDPIDHSGSAVIQLGSGAFHYISGAMHKKGVRIVTPTATICIRGTVLLIGVEASGATTVAIIEGASEVVSRDNGGSVIVPVGSSVAIDARGRLATATKGITKTGDPFVDSVAKEARKAERKVAKDPSKGFKTAAKEATKTARQVAKNSQNTVDVVDFDDEEADNEDDADVDAAASDEGEDNDEDDGDNSNGNGNGNGNGD